MDNNDNVANDPVANSKGYLLAALILAGGEKLFPSCKTLIEFSDRLCETDPDKAMQLAALIVTGKSP